jgi:hypothetical protein
MSIRKEDVRKMAIILWKILPNMAGYKPYEMQKEIVNFFIFRANTLKTK